MVVTIVIIVAIAFILIRFNNFRNRDNAESYYSIPDGIKIWIERGAVIEVAEILIELEENGNIQLVNNVLKAVDYKGYSYASRVDSLRNKMRQEKGLTN